jgi:UDPglucose 6-dehydrogenase/GDP-mannose 6-dehydrogenase
MKVSVIGAGYVGLVSGVCLAEKGHEVTCVDVDQAKIDAIRQGHAPIHEVGLEPLLRRHLGGRLWATSDLSSAVRQTELTLIAVGTPLDGRLIDLAAVRESACQVGQTLREKAAYHVVVVKSTVVPGTTDEVVLPTLEAASGRRAGEDFGVGMNPEFLTEGQAVADFLHPDRIVLGGMDEKTMHRLSELYAGFADVPKIRTNNKTAEMIKYASNALLATMISFANELANLCAALGGVDIVEVMPGVHASNYLNPLGKDGRRVMAPIAAFLKAGCGFGGSCLPKDVQALISHGQRAGLPMRLLQSVIDVNQSQPERIVGLLRKHFPSLSGVEIAVLGLAFKPDTDDMRQSPAIPVIRRLLAEKAVLRAYDPVANRQARRVFGDAPLQYCDDLDQAVEGADALVLLTAWSEFARLPELLARRSPQPLVVDGRRMLDKRTIARYEGVGL